MLEVADAIDRALIELLKEYRLRTAILYWLTCIYFSLYIFNVTPLEESSVLC